ncbi:MAG: hypothetical protein ABSD74_08985 [Rhizomicrobium sp.]|jgi:hypothetical protein
MAAAPTAPVKTAGRSYIVDIVLVTALYVGAILVRPWLVAHAETRALVIAANLLPAIPIWLMFAAAWRYYLRIDEFERHRLLVTLGISFGVGSCAITTYALLMDAGLPPLAITWAWPTLAVSWMITNAIMSIADQQK